MDRVFLLRFLWLLLFPSASAEEIGHATRAEPERRGAVIFFVTLAGIWPSIGSISILVLSNLSSAVSDLPILRLSSAESGASIHGMRIRPRSNGALAQGGAGRAAGFLPS